MDQEDLFGIFAKEAQEEFIKNKNADNQILVQEKVFKENESEVREIQNYERPKNDFSHNKAWKSFKAGLVALLFVGGIAFGDFAINQAQKKSEDNTKVLMTTTDYNKKNFLTYEISTFLYSVRETDGYEFDFLTDEEIAEGYDKIIEIEKKMQEVQFAATFSTMTDQELLEKIVINAYGEKYKEIEDKKKRDYVQLAYELLPESLPQIFTRQNIKYLRNPITVDHIKAREQAMDKNYKITLSVNRNEKQTIKNLGSLIHLINTKSENDFKNASLDNYGQNFLLELLGEAIGKGEYEILDEKYKRDYLQIAYEFLPEDARKKYIKDPIDIERELER